MFDTNYTPFAELKAVYRETDRDRKKASLRRNEGR